MTAKKQARNDSYMSIIPRLRSNRPGICEFPYFLNHQYSLSHIMIKNSQTLWRFFWRKNEGGELLRTAAAAPNGNHYWQTEIVHIISNADSGHSNQSSGVFAPAVQALPAHLSYRLLYKKNPAILNCPTFEGQFNFLRGLRKLHFTTKLSEQFMINYKLPFQAVL